jgi:hypothetical protein
MPDPIDRPPDASALPAFSSTRFAPAVGQTFSCRSYDMNGAAVMLSLTLAELVHRRAPVGWEQYVMMFTGPVEPQLEQGTYELSNDLTGSQLLFMTALAPDDAGLPAYEVVVVRRLDAAEKAALAARAG